MNFPFWPEWKKHVTSAPFRTIVCRLCVLKHGSLTTVVRCLCCSQWWVLVWKGEWLLTNGLWPTTWQWWMVLLVLAVVLGLSRCSWWIGGLKWAELRSSMCSASEPCVSPEGFFSALCDVLGKHGNKPGYLHMTGSGIAAPCQLKGNFIIIRAQSVLWCQMWLI